MQKVNFMKLYLNLVYVTLIQANQPEINSVYVTEQRDLLQLHGRLLLRSRDAIQTLTVKLFFYFCCIIII